MANDNGNELICAIKILLQLISTIAFIQIKQWITGNNFAEINKQRNGLLLDVLKPQKLL